MRTIQRLILSLFAAAALFSAAVETAAAPTEDEAAAQATLNAIKARRVQREITVTHGTLSADEHANQAAATEEEKKYPILSDELTKILRDKGFGITGGYGQALKSSTQMPTFQIRYNFFQKEATTYNNRKFYAQKDKQVTFANVRYTSAYANMNATPGEELTDNKDLRIVGPIISGVYLWGGWTDKEVSHGAEKAKPIFGGLSVGLGPLEKGASKVHVDVGLAFYSNSKMPKDDIYVGLSVDLELFKKFLDIL